MASLLLLLDLVPSESRAKSLVHSLMAFSLGGCLLSVMTVVVHDWRILVVLAGVLTCAPVVLTE